MTSVVTWCSYVRTRHRQHKDHTPQSFASATWAIRVLPAAIRRFRAEIPLRWRCLVLLHLIPLINIARKGLDSSCYRRSPCKCPRHSVRVSVAMTQTSMLTGTTLEAACRCSVLTVGWSSPRASPSYGGALSLNSRVVWSLGVRYSRTEWILFEYLMYLRRRNCSAALTLISITLVLRRRCTSTSNNILTFAWPQTLSYLNYINLHITVHHLPGMMTRSPVKYEDQCP